MAWPDRYELLVTIVLILGSMTVARAQKWSFDASQLGGNVSADTVDMFNAGGQPAGVYHVRVYLNTEQVDETDIPFIRDTREPGAALRACLSAEQLRRWGVRLADDGHPSGRQDCVALSTISGDAGAKFDFAGQRLQLNIPQAYLIPVRCRRRSGMTASPLFFWAGREISTGLHHGAKGAVSSCRGLCA